MRALGGVWIGCAMCRKVDELCRALTPDELGALEALGQTDGQAPAGGNLPFTLAQRLMNLGLVELSCGGLDLTVAGRMALASMQGYEPQYGAPRVA